MLIYMIIYMIMNVGIFVFILLLECDGVLVIDLVLLNCFVWVELIKVLVMLVLMFSFVGVLLMLGFFVKFGVLNVVVDVGMGWLVVVGVLVLVIGVFYYLCIVFYMYFGVEGEGVILCMGLV